MEKREEGRGGREGGEKERKGERRSEREEGGGRREEGRNEERDKGRKRCFTGVWCFFDSSNS